MLDSLSACGRLQFDLSWINLHPIPLSFDPNPIQKVSVSVFVEIDIGSGVRLLSLRRYKVNERGIRPILTLDQQHRCIETGRRNFVGASWHPGAACVKRK